MKRMDASFLFFYFSACSAMYVIPEHEYICSLIESNNEAELLQIKRDPNYYPDFWKTALEDIGVPYAAQCGKAQLCVFLLDIGVCAGKYNPLVNAKNETVIQALFTHIIVRPSDYRLNSARKKIITFLCCAKKMNPPLPRDIAIMILSHSKLIGDLMVKRLVMQREIHGNFFRHTQERLLTSTMLGLNYLRDKALKINPDKEIPEAEEFKQELLAAIAKRISTKPFCWNAKVKEPRNAGKCAIL